MTAGPGSASSILFRVRAAQQIHEVVRHGLAGDLVVGGLSCEPINAAAARRWAICAAWRAGRARSARRHRRAPLRLCQVLAFVTIVASSRRSSRDRTARGKSGPGLTRAFANFPSLASSNAALNTMFRRGERFREHFRLAALMELACPRASITRLRCAFLKRSRPICPTSALRPGLHRHQESGDAYVVARWRRSWPTRRSSTADVDAKIGALPGVPGLWNGRAQPACRCRARRRSPAAPPSASSTA